MQKGDQVEWTKAKKSGNGGIKFFQKFGKVVAIGEVFVKVKPRKGPLINLRKERLHVTGSGPNQLTQAVLKGFAN